MSAAHMNDFQSVGSGNLEAHIAHALSMEKVWVIFPREKDAILRLRPALISKEAALFQ